MRINPAGAEQQGELFFFGTAMESYIDYDEDGVQGDFCLTDNTCKQGKNHTGLGIFIRAISAIKRKPHNYASLVL